MSKCCPFRLYCNIVLSNEAINAFTEYTRPNGQAPYCTHERTAFSDTKKATSEAIHKLN